ncbi:uncharacterized protein CDAR_115401 [Caerostris darwini]|uniref:Uncharacterized protein n=1 Tax=Caerostris darwini TaxID=1538125 RepID=A0AAV4UA30_9ARAC|nr:uncharacterized protein CDAR_115401 [Caerostris darwini]
MSSRTVFVLLCVLLTTVLLVECGTIHSSLGSGDTNRGWKPGGKRSFNCYHLQQEAVFTILEMVKEEVQKITSCERMFLE